MVAPHPDLLKRMQNTENLIKKGMSSEADELAKIIPDTFLDVQTHNKLMEIKPWIEPIYNETVKNDNYKSLSIVDYTSGCLYNQEIPKPIRTLTEDLVLVICVDFSDVPTSTSIATIYDRFFSSTAFSSKTVRNYFAINSRDRYIPSGIVIGWYRASQPITYYTHNEYGLGAAPNASTLFNEIMDVVIQEGSVNWNNININNDEWLHHIVMVIAGEDPAISGNNNRMWPSKWGWIKQIRATPLLYAPGFAMVSEYENVLGGNQIGTTCHEFAHTLGALDLYAYVDNNCCLTGNFSLMGYGSWLDYYGRTPCHIDAYHKAAFGFKNVNIIDTQQNNISIYHNESEDYIYMLKTRNYDKICNYYGYNVAMYEYYLLENRQYLGFDAYIPGHGLLIWHVKHSGVTNSCSALIHIEQADGLYNLRPTGNLGDSGDPYPGTSYNTRFANNTNPNTSLLYREGDDCVAVPSTPIYENLEVSNIIEDINGVITFNATPIPCSVISCNFTIT